MTHTRTQSFQLPAGTRITPHALTEALRHLTDVEQPRHRRLWTYYRNPMRPAAALDPLVNSSERPYRQGQEWGLPPRITGYTATDRDVSPIRAVTVARKEVVIENDIGWRIDALVDYLFGKPVLMQSLAADARRGRVLSAVLDAAFNAAGGLSFLQQVALLGSVYGHVDVVVKLDTAAAEALRAELQSGPGGDAWDRLTPAPATTIHESTRNLSRAALDAAPVRNATAAESGVSEADGDIVASDAPAPRSGESTPDGQAPSVQVAEVHAGPTDDPEPLGDAAHRPGSPATEGPGHDDGRHQSRLIERLAGLIRFEIVHPSRCLVFPRSLAGAEAPEAHGQVWESQSPTGATGTGADLPGVSSPRRRWWQRALSAASRPLTGDADESQSIRTTHLELLTADHWYRFENGGLVSQGRHGLGVVPVVHIQNSASAFEYSGRSDVEPLIPLQDELNTRLSDRAYRITLTSFKMFLGKGIENFLANPVGPGRMWSTDNESAKIEEFGGDERCPSEEAHISDVRSALDRASGVPPVAAGAIKDRLGQLSSAAALRVTLQSLLAKTERRRATYGRGISGMCELALAWLDRAGLLPTTPDERRVDLSWPSPIPENDIERLREAEIKSRLGVPRETVLREIGY